MLTSLAARTLGPKLRWIRTRRHIGTTLHDFRRAQDGGMLVFGLIVFGVILLVAGIAIDMSRYEAERVRLQSTADRAAIAATLMTADNQMSDAEAIALAQAYFDAEGLGDYVRGRIEIVSNSEDGRSVRVDPQASLGTFFLRWAGVDKLNLSTPARAVQGRGDFGVPGEATAMEIVLVLDVSGSMGGGNRIQNLKIAASNLAEKMLGQATPGAVGLSIFTYADFVIPPVGMINAFPNVSGSGPCMDFTVWNQFLGSYTQPMQRRNCQVSENRRTQLYMRNAQEAVNFINGMQLQKGTSIDQGVRFGAMMFDPSIQPVITQLIAQGTIDPIFAGRPFGVQPDGPTQALVLMTDGRNNPNGDRPGSRDQYNANTLATCSALKAAGVVVFTVAFEAPGDAQTLMQQCASSPNHFFNTSGAQLIAAFDTIGTHLETEEVFRSLRLVE